MCAIQRRETCSALTTFVVVVKDEDVWSSCAPYCGPANLHEAPRNFHPFDRWRCHMESTALQHLSPLWTRLLAIPLSDVGCSLNWLPVFHLHQQTPQTPRPNLDEISAAASVSLTQLIASVSSARLEPGLINVTKIQRGWESPQSWRGGTSWRRGGETQGCKWRVGAELQDEARRRRPESLNEQLAGKRPPNLGVWILAHSFSVQWAKSSPASPRAAKNILPTGSFAE